MSNEKPILRGVLHAHMTLVWPNIGLMLYPLCRNWNQLITLMIVINVAWIQYLVSAMLHLKYDGQLWIALLDHNMIFTSYMAQSVVINYHHPNGYFYIAMILYLTAIIQKTYYRSVAFTNGDKFMVVVMLLCGILHIGSMPHSFIRILLIVIAFHCAMMGITYGLKFPLNNHPVMGYHEIMHMETMIILTLSLYSLFV